MTRQNILQKVRKGMEQSGHFVAREIMWDLEKFGISPAFSINGKIQTLKFISEKKLKDCESAMENFWFAEYFQNGHKKTSSPIVVISKKTGKLKEYKNSKSLWIKEFNSDLKKGFFN